MQITQNSQLSSSRVNLGNRPHLYKFEIHNRDTFMSNVLDNSVDEEDTIETKPHVTQEAMTKAI